MLRKAKGMPSGLDFEELYQFVLANSKKVVLIFDDLDGMDTFSVELDDDSSDDYQKPMSMLTIIRKLLKDQFLPGATVIATSRRDKAENISNEISITFPKKLELLGFCRRDMENYVKGFCRLSETDTCAKIWKTVKSQPEFFSLCYLPQVCDLVCLTLKECFERSKTDKDVAMFVPKTITELYQRAIRVIIWETQKYGDTLGTRGYLISNIPQTPEKYMETLKRLAKSKLESSEVSFQLQAKDISQRIVSCGLLTPLRGGYYRFLHTTIQEFLAAQHMVDEMKDIGDVMQFLCSLKNYLEEPKWHRVMQFVFGFLGEKIRNKEIDVPKETLSESLLQWIRSLTPYKEIKDAKRAGRKAANPNKNEKRLAILVIKFLHEMQDDDMMKMCGRELDGGGPNNVCNLSGLDITSIDSTALLYFLVFVQFLTKLTLSENRQTSGLGCFGLATLLNKNRILTNIDLTRISLDDEGIQILCDNINGKPRRKMGLNLSLNRITVKGVESLCDAMVEKQLNLTSLSLRVNSIMVEGAKTLSRALVHSNCNITRLNLYKCEIRNEGVIALCAALQHEDCELVDLDLGKNDINYEGVKSLCDLLKEGRTRLTHLALERNGLKARDIEPLRDALRSNECTLTKLDISGNTIGDAGAECLYHGLTGVNSSRLESLSVGGNEMKDRGIKLLSDALKSEGCSLKRLDLASSKIGDLSMKHICDALKSANCKLTSLDLSFNEINQTGLQYLCEGLQSRNCKIVNLMLSGNNFTKEDKKLVSESLAVGARQNPNRPRFTMTMY